MTTIQIFRTLLEGIAGVAGGYIGGYSLRQEYIDAYSSNFFYYDPVFVERLNGIVTAEPGANFARDLLDSYLLDNETSLYSNFLYKGDWAKVVDAKLNYGDPNLFIPPFEMIFGAVCLGVVILRAIDRMPPNLPAPMPNLPAPAFFAPHTPNFILPNNFFQRAATTCMNVAQQYSSYLGF